MAEDAWNLRDPVKVAGAYTGNSRWSNHAEFVNSRMAMRHASINDLPIREERKYRWPLGRRPDDRPGLSELGF